MFERIPDHFPFLACFIIRISAGAASYFGLWGNVAIVLGRGKPSEQPSFKGNGGGRNESGTAHFIARSCRYDYRIGSWQEKFITMQPIIAARGFAGFSCWGNPN
ncbi:hypothetical protein [Paenibacillus sp. URB8-2]|uniref:hypothetical protein n=1 Tax=Paenibacillus sp. URB8-2 TaxID=2741301 RepID=UPI0015BF2DE2|nr:hypothetical protein [Paenibacillus sp. URB8-2]